MKTDEQLKTDVVKELKWEPELELENVKVSAHLGTVTLQGTVKHFADKYAAERATQRVSGVRAIAQKLHVVPSGVFAIGDTAIAESVVRSLNSHVRLPRDIHVVVEDGWVTLTGDVQWGIQSKAAEDAIQFLPGVKGVTNQIGLQADIDSGDAKHSVEASLHRNEEVDDSAILVAAEGNRITLSGSVPNWAQRRAAATMAWKTPGIMYVQNEMVVGV